MFVESSYNSPLISRRYRSYRSVFVQRQGPSTQLLGPTGRNGGHLTASVFEDFSQRSQSFGVDEALRHYAHEQHTVAAIIQILKDHDLTDRVDLVETSRLDLIFTKEEAEARRRDYEMAKEAGVDLHAVHWVDGKEMNEVS